MFRKLFNNDKGATAIEYGLIAALIAVAGITAFGAVGSGIVRTFDKAGASLSAT